MLLARPSLFGLSRKTAVLTLCVAAAQHMAASTKQQQQQQQRTMSSSHKLTKASGGTLVLEPKKNADSLVIFCHGLGDTAHGWIDTVSDMIAPRFPTTKFVIPTAPTMHVTVNAGFQMPAWYDIVTFARDRNRDADNSKGIDISEATLHGIMNSVMEKNPQITPKRIILAGFSQGGALSLFTGLRYKNTLAGIVVLSAYLPQADNVKPNDEAIRTPVLFAHGDEDQVVPIDLGRDAESRCRIMGSEDVDFQVIEGMPHSADPDEIRYVVSWMLKRLPFVVQEVGKGGAAGGGAAGGGAAGVAGAGGAGDAAATTSGAAASSTFSASGSTTTGSE